MLFSTSSILCLSAAVAGVFAAPVADLETRGSSSLPNCLTKFQQFNIKIRSLEDPSGNRLITPANGQFLVEGANGANFSPNNPTEYALIAGFLVETHSDKYAVVKTTIPNVPHVGDIVFANDATVAANGWAPLKCTSNGSTLACTTTDGRQVLQVCGKYVNFDFALNGNCQDKIAFDVVKTCTVV